MKPRCTPHRQWRMATPLLALLAGLAGTWVSWPVQAAEPPAAALPGLAQVLDPLRQAPPVRVDGTVLQQVALALQQASALQLAQASKTINAALQLDARNPNIHFFNGLIYHLQARQGDGEKADLALEGYRQAIRLEPSHWIAQEFLGLALWERRQYAPAQAAFAEVLLARPNDTVALSRMMAASYLAGDATTACVMAQRLDGQRSDATTAADLRMRAVVYAACGDFDRASAVRQALDGRSPGVLNDRVDGRLADWRALHERAAAAPAQTTPRKLPVQFNMNSYPGGGSGGMTSGGTLSMGGMNGGDGSAVNNAAGALQRPLDPKATRMVLVDVVMVRTEDTIATSRGVNLLSALTLQLGSSTGLPAYSRNFSSSTSGNGGGGDMPGTTLVTRAVTVPALAYSLNLANANSNLNEVLARPTLAAVEGMKSEFFSGTSLNAAVVSGGATGGSAVSIEKKYGVKLSILPRILPDGQIMLAIDAARTFLKPPSTNIGFTYKLEISEIVANANVVMRMGDTLILGGLSEKESTSGRDGVPLLQDTPLLQYLFSQQTKSDFQRSVLILITPRPVAYSWMSEESKAAVAAEGPTPFTPSLDVLRARYADWFKPYPNLASVFHHLNLADLYREFRTGDVTLENWDRMNTTRERLQQALQFLYY